MRDRGEQMGPLHLLLANLWNLHETFHASIIDVIRDCCRNCTWRSVFWSGRSNILPNIFVLIGQERWYFVFVAILVTILWSIVLKEKCYTAVSHNLKAIFLWKTHGQKFLRPWAIQVEHGWRWGWFVWSLWVYM